MKILHLLYESKRDSFGIGGVGIRAYEIYRHLRTRHEITLLCKKYPGARDGEIEGLQHIFVGAESDSLTRTLISYAVHASQFVRHHGKEFDIVIEEFSPAIPTFLHLWTKKPLILQVQGYTGQLYYKKYNLLYAAVLHSLEKVRPPFYRHFIFVSDRTLTRCPLKKNAHYRVIPNGISDELLNLSPEEGDYILYFGRIDIYGKGLDILLSAYHEFVQLFPRIRLKIAGDGRDMNGFKGLLHELPPAVRDNLDLLGWVSGDEKKQALQNALFAVFPSRHEVQPISVLEAMASGKAVLVSNIPEFSFVTEQGAGASFRSGDYSSMAEAMEKILRSDDRRVAGQRGRDWVKNFTWDRIALQYEKFLQDVISRNNQ